LIDRREKVYSFFKGVILLIGFINRATIDDKMLENFILRG